MAESSPSQWSHLCMICFLVVSDSLWSIVKSVKNPSAPLCGTYEEAKHVCVKYLDSM